jgi:hypothetical protein
LERQAKPGAIHAAAIHAPAEALAKAVKTTAIEEQIVPAAIAAPRAKAFARSVVTPVAVPFAGTTPSKSLVKPALTLRVGAPGDSRIIKPAIGAAAELAKPRPQP